MIDQMLEQIHITQSMLGLYYAKIKMSEKIGIKESVLMKLDSADKKTKEEVQEATRKMFRKEVFTAVQGPTGDCFIVDGHHDLYSAIVAQLPLNQTSAQLEIEHNFSGKTIEEFTVAMTKLKYVNAGDEALLAKPKNITAVKDSPERSLVGLAFIFIGKKNNIPFKGTQFKPFVQFQVGDLLHEKKLFQFNDDYSEDNIKALAKTITQTPDVVRFLVQSMTTKTDKDVKNFLENRYKELT